MSLLLVVEGCFRNAPNSFLRNFELLETAAPDGLHSALAACQDLQQPLINGKVAWNATTNFAPLRDRRVKRDPERSLGFIGSVPTISAHFCAVPSFVGRFCRHQACPVGRRAGCCRHVANRKSRIEEAKGAARTAGLDSTAGRVFDKDSWQADARCRRGWFRRADEPWGVLESRRQ